MSCASKVRNIKSACLDIKLQYGNEAYYTLLAEDDEGNPIDLSYFNTVELAVKAKKSSRLPHFYRADLATEDNKVVLAFPRKFFRKSMPKKLHYEVNMKNGNTNKQTWLEGQIYIY